MRDRQKAEVQALLWRQRHDSFPSHESRQFCATCNRPSFYLELVYDIFLAEAWDLGRGGVWMLEAGTYSGQPPEGAEFCKILSREGKCDVQQSEYRVHDWR